MKGLANEVFWYSCIISYHFLRKGFNFKYFVDNPFCCFLNYFVTFFTQWLSIVTHNGWFLFIINNEAPKRPYFNLFVCLMKRKGYTFKLNLLDSMMEKTKLKLKRFSLFFSEEKLNWHEGLVCLHNGHTILNEYWKLFSYV